MPPPPPPPQLQAPRPPEGGRESNIIENVTAPHSRSHQLFFFNSPSDLPHFGSHRRDDVSNGKREEEGGSGGGVRWAGLECQGVTHRRHWASRSWRRPSELRLPPLPHPPPASSPSSSLLLLTPPHPSTSLTPSSFPSLTPPAPQAPGTPAEMYGESHHHTHTHTQAPEGRGFEAAAH